MNTFINASVRKAEGEKPHVHLSTLKSLVTPGPVKAEMTRCHWFQWRAIGLIIEPESGPKPGAEQMALGQIRPFPPSWSFPILIQSLNRDVFRGRMKKNPTVALKACLAFPNDQLGFYFAWLWALKHYRILKTCRFSPSSLSCSSCNSKWREFIMNLSVFIQDRNEAGISPPCREFDHRTIIFHRESCCAGSRLWIYYAF